MSSEGEDEEEEDEEQQEDEDEECEDHQTPTASLSSQPLLIGSCSGFIETTVKIKQNDMLPGPKVCIFACVYVGRQILFSVSDLFLLVHQLELDGKVGCVHLLLSPDQVTHLTDLLAALCVDTGTLTNTGPEPGSSHALYVT